MQKLQTRFSKPWVVECLLSTLLQCDSLFEMAMKMYFVKGIRQKYLKNFMSKKPKEKVSEIMKVLCSFKLFYIYKIFIFFMGKKNPQICLTYEQHEQDQHYSIMWSKILFLSWYLLDPSNYTLLYKFLPLVVYDFIICFIAFIMFPWCCSIVHYTMHHCTWHVHDYTGIFTQAQLL